MKREIDSSEKEPLSLKQAMSNCLRHISGKDGIVSVIGSVNIANNISEGERKIIKSPQTDYTRALDAYAKIFAIGPSYTSTIIESSEKNGKILNLSFMGSAPEEEQLPKFGLDSRDVNSLKDKIKDLSKDPENLDLKTELLSKMLRCNNSHIRNLLDIIGQNLDENTKNLNDKLHKNRLISFEDQNLKSDHFKNFVKENFDKIISQDELKAIEQYAFYDKNIKILPHNNNDELHRGVHVEVKGMYELRRRNSSNKEFTFGLSNNFGRQPGCCAGCTAECKALEKNDFIINRTADYPFNFAPGGYVPSGNVTQDPAIFKDYVEVLISNCNTAVDKINNINNFQTNRTSTTTQEQLSSKLESLKNSYRDFLEILEKGKEGIKEEHIIDNRDHDKSAKRKREEKEPKGEPEEKRIKSSDSNYQRNTSSSDSSSTRKRKREDTSNNQTLNQSNINLNPAAGVLIPKNVSNDWQGQVNLAPTTRPQNRFEPTTPPGTPPRTPPRTPSVTKDSQSNTRD